MMRGSCTVSWAVLAATTTGWTAKLLLLKKHVAARYPGTFRLVADILLARGEGGGGFAEPSSLNHFQVH